MEVRSSTHRVPSDWTASVRPVRLEHARSADICEDLAGEQAVNRHLQRQSIVSILLVGTAPYMVASHVERVRLREGIMLVREICRA